MFKELRPLLATGRPVMLSVCLQDDDVIQVAVIPEALKEDEHVPAPEARTALCAPCTLLGTAEELDELLPHCLGQYTGSHASLVQTVGEVLEQLAEAERAVKAAAEAKRKKGGAAGTGSPRTPVLVHTETAPAGPSLFDAVPAEPAGGAVAAGASDSAAAPAATS